MQTIRVFIHLPERAFDDEFSCYFSILYMISTKIFTITPWR